MTTLGMSLTSKLKELQNKPYAEKIKLLRRVIFAAGVILVLFWFLTLRFRSATEQNQSFGIFREIYENLKNIKNPSPSNPN